MQIWHVWFVAAIVYVLFRLWYDNWRGPLKAAEIDRYMALAVKAWPEGVNDLAMIRRFLEADDGREFVMVNIVRLRSDTVPSPVTGEPMTGLQLIQAYLKVFSPTLLASGGVPYLSAGKIAGYVDPVNVAPDPGWSFAGLMRYRSRRDMMRLSTDPRFNAAHKFKLLAIANAMAFPARIMSGFALGPRVTVLLGLTVLAGAAHIVLLTA